MIEEVLNTIKNSVFGLVPENYRLIAILLFFTIIIAIYGIFVFKFYKFLARRNIVDLDLNKYNTSEHPFFTKIFAILFYVLEYIIILPIITSFWFAILAIFLLVLSKTQDVSMILTISAALIAAVRLTSYISENLSQDLAKMLPFTLLGLFLIEPGFFSVDLFIDRIGQIPSLLSHVPYFIVFIILLEFILRIITLGTDFIKSED